MRGAHGQDHAPTVSRNSRREYDLRITEDGKTRPSQLLVSYKYPLAKCELYLTIYHSRVTIQDTVLSAGSAPKKYQVLRQNKIVSRMLFVLFMNAFIEPHKLVGML